MSSFLCKSFPLSLSLLNAVSQHDQGGGPDAAGRHPGTEREAWLLELGTEGSDA